MPRLMIRAGLVLTPQEEITGAAVVVEDSIIASIGPRESLTASPHTREVDAQDCAVVPGFVDIHIHGAAGHDVMEGTPAALDAIAATVAAHGTTAFLATTVSAPADVTCRSVERIANYIQATESSPPDSPRAHVIGIHFEGPFISPVRRGVHPLEALARPSVETLDRLLEAAGGFARILTLAPELPGVSEIIAAARARGITVAMGHTDATYDQACAGIDAGIRHAVHVFNAMRPFSHRETGVLGAVLTDRRVSAEIIADGIHVDAPAIRLLLAAKGTDNVILVSDATAATGMPDGAYKLGTFEFNVAGGVCRNSEGRLAGSTLTLDRAIRQVVSLGVPLQEAIRMATLNSAQRLGLERKGVLAPGADADLVLLRRDLTVAGVMTRGNLKAPA